jgi:hypothetical protein
MIVDDAFGDSQTSTDSKFNLSSSNKNNNTNDNYLFPTGKGNKSSGVKKSGNGFLNSLNIGFNEDNTIVGGDNQSINSVDSITINTTKGITSSKNPAAVSGIYLTNYLSIYVLTNDSILSLIYLSIYLCIYLVMHLSRYASRC